MGRGHGGEAQKIRHVRASHSSPLAHGWSMLGHVGVGVFARRLLTLLARLFRRKGYLEFGRSGSVKGHEDQS